MAKARTKSTTLPLNDPRWWVLDRAHQYRRQQIGDDILATQDIRLAIEGDNLPTKIEAYDQRIQTRIAQLLPGWFFKCQFQIIYTYRHAGGGDLGAYPRRLMRRLGSDFQNLTSPTVFVWGPKVEELWPDHVATQATATETISAPTEQQRQAPLRITCASVLPDIVKAHPRPPDVDNYSEYLRQFMPRKWSATTIANELARAGLTNYTAHTAHKPTTKNRPAKVRPKP
jgi:hypothetical protein